MDYAYICGIFGDKAVKKENGSWEVITSPFKPTDEFYLEPGEYHNKARIRTTIGQLITNKYFFEEDDLFRFTDYINKAMTKKVYGDINAVIADAYMTDLTSDELFRFFKRTEFFMMKMHHIISCSLTADAITPDAEVVKRKKELIEKNKDKIAEGDVVTAAKMQDELLAIAEKNLKAKGDVTLDLFKSGARGAFDNAYKNIAVMRGAVFNPTTGKYDIVTSNYMEGISKEDMGAMANSIISGAYPKAIGTGVSGYLSKQLNAALQSIVIHTDIFDCGSKGYIEEILTMHNTKDFMYRYMIEGSKLVLLEPSNSSKYIGKKIKFRSPMFCKNTLCVACAGQQSLKLENKNVGLTANKLSSTLTNYNMKKFHSNSVKIKKIDLNDISF